MKTIVTFQVSCITVSSVRKLKTNHIVNFLIHLWVQTPSHPLWWELFETIFTLWSAELLWTSSYRKHDTEQSKHFKLSHSQFLKAKLLQRAFCTRVFSVSFLKQVLTFLPSPSSGLWPSTRTNTSIHPLTPLPQWKHQRQLPVHLQKNCKQVYRQLESLLRIKTIVSATFFRVTSNRPDIVQVSSQPSRRIHQNIGQFTKWHTRGTPHTRRRSSTRSRSWRTSWTRTTSNTSGRTDTIRKTLGRLWIEVKLHHHHRHIGSCKIVWFRKYQIVGVYLFFKCLKKLGFSWREWKGKQKVVCKQLH